MELLQKRPGLSTRKISQILFDEYRLCAFGRKTYNPIPINTGLCLGLLLKLKKYLSNITFLFFLINKMGTVIDTLKNTLGNKMGTIRVRGYKYTVYVLLLYYLLFILCVNITSCF